MAIIARGAEAVLSAETQDGGQIVRKERIPKGYRIQQLDENIRSSRTRLERNILIAARRAGVNVPRVLGEGPHTLLLEKIEGQTVNALLLSASRVEAGRAGLLMGEQAGRLHAAGIAHGDLTTSNMIFDLQVKKLWLIDFGLGRQGAGAEELAADLYVLSEALKAADTYRPVWKSFLRTYRQVNPSSGAVLQRYEKIAVRRRYRGE